MELDRDGVAVPVKQGARGCDAIAVVAVADSGVEQILPELVGQRGPDQVVPVVDVDGQRGVVHLVVCPAAQGRAVHCVQPADLRLGGTGEAEKHADEAEEGGAKENPREFRRHLALAGLHSVSDSQFLELLAFDHPCARISCPYRVGVLCDGKLSVRPLISKLSDLCKGLM